MVEFEPLRVLPNARGRHPEYPAKRGVRQCREALHIQNQRVTGWRCGLREEPARLNLPVALLILAEEGQASQRGVQFGVPFSAKRREQLMAETVAREPRVPVRRIL